MSVLSKMAEREGVAVALIVVTFAGLLGRGVEFDRAMTLLRGRCWRDPRQVGPDRRFRDRLTFTCMAAAAASLLDLGTLNRDVVDRAEREVDDLVDKVLDDPQLLRMVAASIELRGATARAVAVRTLVRLFGEVPQGALSARVADTRPRGRPRK